VYLTPDK